MMRSLIFFLERTITNIHYNHMEKMFSIEFAEGGLYLHIRNAACPRSPNMGWIGKTIDNVQFVDNEFILEFTDSTSQTVVSMPNQLLGFGGTEIKTENFVVGW